MNMLVVIFRMF